MALPPSVSIYITECTAIRGGFHYHQTIPNDDGIVDPISERGWTYQEAMLSARYLKFTRADVQWKCSEETACLCGEWPEWNNELEWGGFENQDDETMLMAGWQLICENFSGRRLTKETDKLAAISDLTKRYDAALQRAVLDLCYIAGCWSFGVSDLGYLDWHAKGQEYRGFYKTVPGRCPESYVAPTFTWPSVNTRISFPEQPNTYLSFCVITGVKNHPVSQGNRFGPVDGEHLMLRGPLLPGCVMGTDSFDSQVKVRMGKNGPVILDNCGGIYCYIDCDIAQSTSTKGARSLHRCPGSKCSSAMGPPGSHRTLLAFPSLRSEDNTDKTGIEVLLLHKDMYGRSDVGIIGLLLGRHDPDREIYHRIGRVEFWGLPDRL